ncbi:hypothetical protein QYE76_057353 [Lolium multiflorum]|uniref:Cystatin domain-containing protein n=1 Tax=Lolium multiflorum TaxID=4521 RepID=A0AAD8T4G8_LOLMU|nr:hypothetical protein QYE76_057353 [Lolium multiflorum]
MARVIGPCALLVLLVACSALAASAAREEPSGARPLWGGDGGRGRKVGARTEVRDVEENREVQELGRYSVAEHNRRQREEEGDVRGRLEFHRVVSAQRQVVAGIKYYLRVAAADDRVFDAVVVVKPWLQSRALLRFAPADVE